jgi:hypothetical protein
MALAPPRPVWPGVAQPGRLPALPERAIDVIDRDARIHARPVIDSGDPAVSPRSLTCISINEPDRAAAYGQQHRVSRRRVKARPGPQGDPEARSRRSFVIDHTTGLVHGCRDGPAHVGIEAIPRQQCIRSLTPLSWVGDAGQGPGISGEQALGSGLIG